MRYRESLPSNERSEHRPAENIERAQELLAGLRHRIAPILRKEQIVSRVDEFYGFRLLDTLRDTLNALKKQLPG